MRKPRRSTYGWVAAIIVALVTGVVAGTAAFQPPQTEARAVTVEKYTVSEGAVGRTTTYMAQATWSSRPLGVSAVTGTVTSIAIKSGQQVDAGSTLYTVDLMPVVIAQGEVPSFRDLSNGVEGPDVKQLQKLLKKLGYFWGSSTGTFGDVTEAAVRRWQKALKREETGTVAASSIIFTPTLPVAVQLSSDVTVGSRLNEGMITVKALSSVPTFTVEVSSNSDPPSVGTEITVTVEDQKWPAVVASIDRNDSGDAIAVLSGVDGKPICETQACAAVPSSAAATTYVATATIVPETTGPLVPVSAIATDASGKAFVSSVEGKRIPVDVVATDGSRCVVSGISEGDVIRLFALEESVDSAGDATDESAVTEGGS